MNSAHNVGGAKIDEWHLQYCSLAYVQVEKGGMDSIPYAEFVHSLVKPLSTDMHLLHMSVGAAGEVGELVDAVKKHVVYEREPDVENIKEEIGDLFFFVQELMLQYNLTFYEILHHNVAKLEKRYHEKKFSTQQAQARADKAADSFAADAAMYKKKD